MTLSPDTTPHTPDGGAPTGGLGSTDMASVGLAFRDWFGLSPTEAAVLAALYQAAGAPLDAAQLARRAGSTPGAISVHIVQIRRALEADAIDCLPRAGYAMTAEGLAECRGAILTIANALRACA